MTSFSDFPEDLEWFENLLTKNGININSESHTARSIRELRNIIDYYTNKSGSLEEDNILFRDKTRRAFGLLSQIWALKKCPSDRLQLAIEKIKIYRSKEISLISSEENSQHRNFAWELVSFCCLSRFTEKTDFNEPDISALYGGVKFGFPCKVLYSENPEKQAATIIKGVKQLETSDCEFGLILVNVSNLLLHDNFFPLDPNGEFMSYKKPELAMQIFRTSLLGVHKQIEKFEKSFNERIVYDSTNGTLRNKTLGVIYYSQTLANIQKKPVLLSNAVFHPRNSDYNGLNIVAQNVSDNFNKAAYGINFR